MLKCAVVAGVEVGETEVEMFMLLCDIGESE